MAAPCPHRAAGPVVEGRSAGGDSDAMALGVGEHAKAGPGHLLCGLDDRTPELFCPLQRGDDVRNADEEQHLVLVSLTRADCSVGRPVDPGVNERVAGESTFGPDLPVKQVPQELPCRVGILGANLNVDHWVRHDISYGFAGADSFAGRSTSRRTTPRDRDTPEKVLLGRWRDELTAGPL